jgi:hypothetical protein
MRSAASTADSNRFHDSGSLSTGALILALPGKVGMVNDVPWDIQQPLFKVVGAIVIRWGLVDTLIASTCSVLFEKLGGHPTQTEPPRNFRRRLDYIRKCFRHQPKLAHLSAELSSIANAAGEIAGLRDAIMHGALTGYKPHNSNPVFRFTKLDIDKLTYEQSSMNISSDDLLKLVEAMDNVTARLSLVADQFLKIAGI